MDFFEITGREESLFSADLNNLDGTLTRKVRGSRFLVVGAAGTIGQATVKEIFKRDPALLHVVDISENNLVELVRDLRSSFGYGNGEFATFALDCGSEEFAALCRNGSYDFVLNLSALKHVRSESDPFTLMRLTRTNILNSVITARLARASGASKYFCVSTDKAANPVNMMGASKRIMELFMARESEMMPISMARFANVAYSDGSLLHGFRQRLQKKQPLSAPSDVKRYFVSPQESGELCLLSTLTANNLEIYFPKLSEKLHLTRFSDIAKVFLKQHGFDPVECESEQQARDLVPELARRGKWPCYFFNSDTTGEKDFEEFFTNREELDWDRFESIGVIQSFPRCDEELLLEFERALEAMIQTGRWSKSDLVQLYVSLVADFEHLETGKYLDQRM